MSNFLKKLQSFRFRRAITDHKGSYSYDHLLRSSTGFSDHRVKPLLANATSDDSGTPRIAYLTERDSTYVLSQISTWQSGACAIPLSTSSTRDEIDYFLTDS